MLIVGRRYIALVQPEYKLLFAWWESKKKTSKKNKKKKSWIVDE